MPLEKPARMRFERFLEFVRGLPCLVCFDARTEAHHVISRGAGGSDFRAVPLCRLHHVEFHRYGRDTFANKYTMDWNVAHLALIEAFIFEGGFDA